MRHTVQVILAHAKGWKLVGGCHGISWRYYYEYRQDYEEVIRQVAAAQLREAVVLLDPHLLVLF